MDKPVERELLIVIDKDYGARYEGTRAQLEAEGVIPQGMQWPAGKSSAEWQANGLDFLLNRRRPPDMKGPARLWLEGDYWGLNFWPHGRTYLDGKIKSKARELKELLYWESEEGQRRCRDYFDRRRQAANDKQFQAFLAKLPALGELALRRDGRKAKASQESANG